MSDYTGPVYVTNDTTDEWAFFPSLSEAVAAHEGVTDGLRFYTCNVSKPALDLLEWVKGWIDDEYSAFDDPPELSAAAIAAIASAEAAVLESVYDIWTPTSDEIVPTAEVAKE